MISTKIQRMDYSLAMTKDWAKDFVTIVRHNVRKNREVLHNYTLIIIAL